MIAEKTFSKKNKIIKKNKKIRKTSFKSYVKTLYQDVDSIMKKKRKKVLNDDFEILQFSQYNDIVTKNYNVQQLKKI